MTGLVFTPTPDNPAVRRFGHRLLPSTFGETMSATFGDPLLRPSQLLSRQEEITGAQLPPEDGFIDIPPDLRALSGGRTRAQADDDDVPISPEQLNEEFKDLGLNFERPASRRVANIMARNKREEMVRADIIARGPQGVLPTAARFGAMLAGAAIDPLNIAAGFVPVVGEARFAGLVARLGKPGARAVRGALEGVIGNAAVEPIVYGLAQQQQLDYGMSDALVNVALGGVIGGGLHVGAGRIGDFVEARRPETREAALRAAVAQTAEGKRVEVEPVIRDAFDPREVFAEAREAPVAEDFRLGELSGSRYFDYTPIREGDRAHIEGIIAELESTDRGQRIFIEAEGQGGTREVIGQKATTPEWFQTANREIAAEQKRLAQQRRNLTDAEKEKLPSSAPILTRANVRKVTDKLLAGEPLGKAEGKIAEEIMAEARSRRMANVEDMVAFRRLREQRQADEVDAVAAREAEPIRDATAEFDAAERIAAQEPVSEAETEAAFAVERFDSEALRENLPDDLARELEEIDARVEHANAYARGIRAAAVCLGRTA